MDPFDSASRDDAFRVGSPWDALPDPIALADADGKLRFLNAAARRWLGNAAAHAADLSELLRGCALDPQPLERAAARLAEVGQAECRLLLRNASGGERPVRLRLRRAGEILLAQWEEETVHDDAANAPGDRHALLLDLLGATMSDLEYPLGALRWCAALDDESLARLPGDLHRPFRAVRKAARHFSDLFAGLDLRGSGGEDRSQPRNLMRLLVWGGGATDCAALLDRLRAGGLRCTCRPGRDQEDLLRAAASGEADAVIFLAGAEPSAAAAATAELQERAPRVPCFDAAESGAAGLAERLSTAWNSSRRIGAADEVWRRVEELALRDALTGVLNRRAFERFAAQEFARARRYGYALAIALFDLDWFKEVNDTLGHAAGDRLLQVFANYLHSSVRQSDLVARLGGDEFALLMTHTDGEGALALTQRLRDTGESHLRDVLPPLDRMPGVSVGLAVHPGAGVNRFEELLAAADTALYRAKRDGRGRLRPAGEPPPRQAAGGAI